MTVSVGDSSEMYVDLAKLIYQLSNGRVILERLPEHLVDKLLSTKRFITDIKHTEDIHTDLKNHEGELETVLEQSKTNAKSDDDSTKSNGNELEYQIIHQKYNGSRIELMKGYCQKCKKLANCSTKRCLTCNKVYKHFECGGCNAQFSILDALKWHLYKCQQLIQIFMCRICDYQCILQSKILEHLKGHDEPIASPHCGRSDFENNESRMRHLTTCVKNRRFQSESLNECSGEGKTTLNIISHCYNCNESYTDNILNTKCSKCKENYKMFQCGKCLMQYAHFSSISCHVHYRCMPRKTFSCRICNYQCHLRCRMLKHLQVHTKSIKTDGVNYRTVYKDNGGRKKKLNYMLPYCHHCNETSTKLGLQCPRCQEDYKNFRCAKCQFECSSFTNVEYHINYKCMPAKIFFCKKCDYQTSIKTSNKKHVKKRPELFKCPICQKQFVNFRSRGSHIRFCRQNPSFNTNFGLNNNEAL